MSKLWNEYRSKMKELKQNDSKETNNNIDIKDIFIIAIWFIILYAASFLHIFLSCGVGSLFIWALIRNKTK